MKPLAFLNGAVLTCAALAAGPLQAAVVCTGPGYPPGCVEVDAAPVRVYARPVAAPGGPVVNPTPGVGYGAPGAGLRPAAGPGVGPNAGGPMNRPGFR
ncbi:MAG: hypothetical protein RLZZ515_396 [Cyanobacteriota bacterium]|jgi:hypothetical protein